MKKSENAFYIGNKNKLDEWCYNNENEDQSKDEELDNKKEEDLIEKIQEIIKNYLQLDNVSFLFGTGSSIHLGAASIQSIPSEIENEINAQNKEIQKSFKEAIQAIQKKQFKGKFLKEGDIINEDWKYIYDGSYVRDFKETVGSKEIKSTEKTSTNPDGNKQNEDNTKHDENYGNISVMLETLLNYLIAKKYVYDEEGNEKESKKANDLIIALKRGLFKVCDVHKRKTPARDLQRIQDMGLDTNFSKDKYLFHEKFLKSLLQRPLNLQRANIFTCNYDLAFEYAFDNLGIKYIDGFSGFHHRYFKPETFNYDIFYPGTTTSGKVQRIEKVVRYFKLHGSISWIQDTEISASNIYGIEEMPLDFIKLKGEQSENGNSFSYGNLMIYPSAVKKSYTLDLPYSELFRHFSYAVSQPQSVLFTIGYSFCDEHFNDIIYQALTNPSFTLFIVDYNGTKNKEINRLKSLNDPRIIIMEGRVLGDFLAFSDKLMPNFMDTSSSDKIADIMNNILSKK